MKITFDRKYEQLRIYFEDVLHIQLRTLDLLGVHTWIHGKSEHFIEYIFRDGTKITSVYRSKDVWKDVLKIIVEQLDFG